MPLGTLDITKPFRHLGRHGVVMRADSCDLSGGYDLYRPKAITDEQFASGVAEIFCWFYANIVPELNGFNLPSCRKVYPIA